MLAHGQIARAAPDGHTIGISGLSPLALAPHQYRNLPYHPLWHEGYVSIGDFHTTTRWEPGMKDEDTRFFGLKRECGIHEDI